MQGTRKQSVKNTLKLSFGPEWKTDLGTVKIGEGSWTRESTTEIEERLGFVMGVEEDASDSPTSIMAEYEPTWSRAAVPDDADELRLVYPFRDGTYGLPNGLTLYPIKVRRGFESSLPEHDPQISVVVPNLKPNSPVVKFRNYAISFGKVTSALRGEISAAGIDVPTGVNLSRAILIKLEHPTQRLQRWVLMPPARPVGPISNKDLTIVIEREAIDEGVYSTRNVYLLEWDPKNGPRKLGSGQFGVVYRVTDTRKNPITYAMKILYARQAETRSTDSSSADIGSVDDDDAIANISSLARLRIRHEMEIDNRIRTVFPKLGIVGTASDYVSPIDYTQTFLQSNAANTLENWLSDRGQQANYSNFAIVMDYCDFTLKDLLEKPWYVQVKGQPGGDVSISEQEFEEAPKSNPELAQSDNARTEVKVFLGYNLLDALPFKERVSVILPYIQGLLNGISILHAAGVTHHDLKPGNIFVKRDGTRLKVKVGDFSFVAPAVRQGTTVAFLRDAISTGTVHFRAPEQRDFADVCEATVVHRLSPQEVFAYNADCAQARKAKEFQERSDLARRIEKISDMIARDEVFLLRTRDPKFQTADVGPDAALVFSEDRKGSVRQILMVVPREHYSDIWLDLDLGSSSSTQVKAIRDQFPNGEKTQVTVYKLPGMQADIFGVGSVIFDLLTAGQSPEAFYEKWRAIDVPRSHSPGAPGFKVEECVRWYQGFAGEVRTETRSTEGGDVGEDTLRYIFSDFTKRRGTKIEFAPSWIVKTILECMSYHASDNLQMRYETLRRKAHDSNPDVFQYIQRQVFTAVDVAAAEIDKQADIQQPPPDGSVSNFLLNPEASSIWKNSLVPRLNGQAAGDQITIPEKSLWERLVSRLR